MKKCVRIAEFYDGGFTELYLDLLVESFALKIVETSFHYNERKEKLIGEIIVPNDLISCEEILNFICVNVPEIYKVDIDLLKTNEQMIDFIEDFLKV